MRMIFLRSTEWPGKESGGQGRWRGNPGIQFDLPKLSLRLCSSQYVSKVRSSFCVLSRAKIQRSLEQRYAIKFCAKLGKIWFRNVAVVEDSLWGWCFVFSPSPQVAQGLKGWKEERWGQTARRAFFNFKKMRTVWLMWRLFWIGTDIWACN